jgi:hypothetical protein
MTGLRSRGGVSVAAETPDERRPLPDFFVRWRAGWGESAQSWLPVDYLNQDQAVPAAIAAGWLFNPSTVEYRGAVFLVDRFDPATVDEWFEHIPNDPGRVENVVNQITLYDFFVNCDLAPYEDALAQLAADIGACWSGVLAVRYPDRVINVVVDDGASPPSYGPAVSFWTQRRSSAAATDPNDPESAVDGT